MFRKKIVQSLGSDYRKHEVPKHWDLIDDPVEPLERNFNVHPLAALLWEVILLEEGRENPRMGVPFLSSQNTVILASLC